MQTEKLWDQWLGMVGYKIGEKMASWMHRTLSLGRRMILIKFGIATYHYFLDVTFHVS